MTNNDVLRRVRYIFDLADRDSLAIFALGGLEVTPTELAQWFKRDEDPDCVAMHDHALACFLNGFIVKRRGPRDGPAAVAEHELTNNSILVKLKIALSLQADDVLAMVCSDGMVMSRHELSAFFRKPGHKHYRVAMNQVLRNFFGGVEKRFRPKPAVAETAKPAVVETAKPAVVETAKPAVVETAKPPAVETAKPPSAE